jgi:phosphatidylglycerophosphate synthase
MIQDKDNEQLAVEDEHTKTDFASSLKSQDTEEWLDIHFTRPIGYLWARIAMKLHITPNMITVASIFIGTYGAILFYPNSLKKNFLGMLLFVLANTFDSADGQLARLTNHKTQLGRILDGAAGDVWFFTIYLVITLRLVHTGLYSTIGIWVLASCAGASHILHASMADYYRNVHLFFAKGKNGSEHDNSKTITKQLHETKFSKKPFTKTCLWFYRNYTKTQEMLSPKLQEFFRTLIRMYGDNVPQDLCSEIREKNRKYMPLTNILQFNIRVLFLFFTMFINKVWLYFCLDLVVMNLILTYLIIKGEKLFYSYDKELKSIEQTRQ